jgi:hypothetical protein
MAQAGHTAEQRDRHELCNAKKKNGERCRAFAGQGTDHFGIGTCKFHGGATRHHYKHAVKVAAKREMVKYGAPINIHPNEALLAMLYLSSGHVAWLHSEIANYDENARNGKKKLFDEQMLLMLYSDERDRVARIAKAAIDCGIAERQVALMERCGTSIASVLRRVFEDAELSLTKKQQAKLPDLLRRHLSDLETTPDQLLGLSEMGLG